MIIKPGGPVKVQLEAIRYVRNVQGEALCLCMFNVPNTVWYQHQHSVQITLSFNICYI